jgi:hypothetical protein
MNASARAATAAPTSRASAFMVRAVTGSRCQTPSDASEPWQTALIQC